MDVPQPSCTLSRKSPPTLPGPYVSGVNGGLRPHEFASLVNKIFAYTLSIALYWKSRSPDGHDFMAVTMSCTLASVKLSM